MRITQKTATRLALKAAAEGEIRRMAIVLTTDEHTGEPTHEYCPEQAVDLLYGPLLKAGIAKVVDRVSAA
jgi:hypothetical protein